MMPDENDEPFTAETLQNYAARVEALRISLLCSVDDAGGDPLATQFFLLALGYLEMASHALQIAAVHQGVTVKEA